MAKDKQHNPSTKNNSDPYPGRVNPESMRSKIDPDNLGVRKQHERDISKLDRGLGPERGGR
jgi:hypothetical protein